MGEKLVVGPVNRGLRNDRTAFVIDNDSFPNLINAYQWRGRIKRKRGTAFLGRLTRYFNSTSLSYSSSSTITLDGGGNGNLLTGFTLQSTGNIVPGTVSIFDTVSSITYTDPSENGTLSPSGTIDYATGGITIAAAASHAISATFVYYPGLPVMGLEDFIANSSQFPGTLGFDTVYSYNISPVFPYNIYDVSFYKNPTTSSLYPGYIPKTNVTPLTWNGANYQQFWTINYQGALWATNGITEPFNTTNVGMQFKPIVAVTLTSGGPPAIVNLQITGHGLVVGDFLFINEVATTTGINYQTGYVTAVVDANNVTVEFPNATIASNGTGGIAQYLTNRSNPTLDCLRWYDGDPTNGSETAPVLNGHLGWVNFMPPLSNGIAPLAELPQGQYYLVGAKLIFPFKDRLLFFGPVVQTSATGASPIFLQDTVVYSQNGTTYYTASFTGNPALATTTFNPILVPVNQTGAPNAYWSNQTGFGGWITAGVDQEIFTVGVNEDVLIVGFTRLQTRLIYSGNDVVPFNFFVINSELGSGSTFSVITLDKGVLSRGSRGFLITSQVESRRIDLEIPDEVFEIDLLNNGSERIAAVRDYINEWVYFTYCSNQENPSYYIFPTQTLQYNYRDNSWAIFKESYTTYGTFRRQTGFTWATVGSVFPTWSSWNQPWNAGSSTLLQPKIIGGNQQGFILERDDGTNEGTSLYIQSFSSSVVTSPNHCLEEGDYIIISGCLGTVGTEVNNQIFSVYMVMQNAFMLDPPISSGLTYVGGGLITKMYVPFIQTKQFPVAWGNARKTRLGPQQYLFTTTDIGQVTLLIYLSQDADNSYNSGPVVPDPNSDNDSLIYSALMYTCPESTNLGLTPANVNLQMPTAINQEQIWHRMNTSLLGDTVQIGVTLSDAQMRSLTPVGNSFPITGATNAYPCVLTCAGMFEPGSLIQITGVQGMTQLNFNPNLENNYSVISSNATTVTINIDSTSFGTYASGGSAIVVAPIIQFSEIELHGFILDVSPSQVLA